jgi:hypothetical protein
MTLEELLWNARSSVEREHERHTERVDAVYDDQLWAILDSLGLLVRLDAGELTCPISGVRLTRDNVAGLLGTASGPQVVAQVSSSDVPHRRD